MLLSRNGKRSNGKILLQCAGMECLCTVTRKESGYAAEIFEKLIVKKMLVRDASSFEFLDESYIRFCIMSPEDNKRLLEELKKIIE